MDIQDEDPVVAEYDVYITPEVAEQQLYVLQYLNRPPNQPFTKATDSQPSALRIKKESGFIEVDVPVNIHRNYNRVAGVRWGEAMRKTKGFGQKAFGIASGFERTMPRSTNRPGAAGEGGAPAAPIATEDDDNFEEYVTHFDDANEKGHVFNTQTFGGQIMHNEGKGPSYMLGTFRDSKWRAPTITPPRLTRRRRTPPHTLQRPRPTSYTVPPHRRLRPARSSPAPSREGVTRRRQGRRAQGLPRPSQEDGW
jgi:DNA-directed RNA polymerase-3 subunit RPC5